MLINEEIFQKKLNLKILYRIFFFQFLYRIYCIELPFSKEIIIILTFNKKTKWRNKLIKLRGETNSHHSSLVHIYNAHSTNSSSKFSIAKSKKITEIKKNKIKNTDNGYWTRDLIFTLYLYNNVDT